jgi:UDP-N-acetylglucosamine 2-epimerase (non-hydrolysing)/GDP/UDP-N,N'-diacetylbacillosamine 2-epimerase (hydrolysing)
MTARTRRVCVVTGTRAEYGLLFWVLKGLRAEPDLELQLVVTGAHLSPAHGLTYREIEADGFTIQRKVDMQLSGDTVADVTKSLGRATIGFADALAGLQPDLILLTGDRYEMLAAAQAALIARIPAAHIAGGDVTEGAYDDAIRHGITKMSHLHFVTHEAASRRVRQLGEDPARIFNVGNPGLDHLRHLPLLEGEDLVRELGFSFRRHNLLVTYHPETLDQESTASRIAVLLAALERLGKDVGIIFTLPNADTGNQAIRQHIETFVSRHDNACVFASLGQHRYLSVLNAVDAVVGNSSSGILEAPSLHTPTVNIGDRQKGRPQAASVINCGYVADEIVSAVHRAFELDCRAVTNPYGDGQASEKIVAILKKIDDPQKLIKKHFFDL